MQKLKSATSISMSPSAWARRGLIALSTTSRSMSMEAISIVRDFPFLENPLDDQLGPKLSLHGAR